MDFANHSESRICLSMNSENTALPTRIPLPTAVGIGSSNVKFSVTQIVNGLENHSSLN